MNVKQAIDRYGNTPLIFKEYHKLTFIFQSTPNAQNDLIISIGGDELDIYRFSFCDTYSVNTLSEILTTEGEGILQHIYDLGTQEKFWIENKEEE